MICGFVCESVWTNIFKKDIILGVSLTRICLSIYIFLICNNIYFCLIFLS